MPSFSYTFGTSTEVIAGSTIAVTTEGGITYSELVSELQSQPYIISSVSIFTNSQIQAVQRFRKTEKQQNGITLIDFDRPRLDPMQNQFAIEGIETKFTPSSLNSLNYNIKGSESVLLWLYYDRIDMSDFNEVKKVNDEIVAENIQRVEPIKNVAKNYINPLFDLL